MVIRFIRIISIFFVLYFVAAWFLHYIVENARGALPLFLIFLIVLLVAIVGYLRKKFKEKLK